MSYDTFDAYFWPGQACMANKLGIHNPIVLDDAVNAIVFENMTEFAGKPWPEKFDPDFLKGCHRDLFGDVYDWAGEYRECPMGRNMDYADPADIPAKIETFCAGFRKDFLEKAFDGPGDMGPALAGQWAALNAIHPFRDGNGRSQYAFFESACRAKGYELSASRQDLKNLRLARDSASEGRPGLLGNMLSRSLARTGPDTMVRERAADRCGRPRRTALMKFLTSFGRGRDDGTDNGRDGPDAP